MRIIRGNWKSRRINPPANLPVRPTTDLAKEALFNVLENTLDFDDLEVLDLFAGTGNISFEFASRGAQQVTAIEQNFRCAEFIRKTAHDLNMPQLTCIRSDVFRFLKTAKQQYHLIFADPPYDLPQLPTLPELIFQHNLLCTNGIFVLEHSKTHDFSTHEHFVRCKEYGKTRFSFFSMNRIEN